MKYLPVILLATCVWVQYEPAGSAIPGFIDATVSGTEDNPPILDDTRSEISVPLGTQTDGMMVDTTQNPPALVQAQ